MAELTSALAGHTIIGLDTNPPLLDLINNNQNLIFISARLATKKERKDYEENVHT